LYIFKQFNLFSFLIILNSGVIFIKTGNSIETDKSIPGQLQSIVLREDSLYESLHLYLSCAVSPFFKSYLRESSKVADSRDFSGDKMGPSVEKKLVELEMGLLHLQQNVDIPEISLTPHPTISHIIRTCSEQGSFLFFKQLLNISNRTTSQSSRSWSES
jgi:dynein heavy chain 1